MIASKKARWSLLVLVVSAVTFAPSSGRGEQATLEEIRLNLRKEGFKPDLSDFNFAVPQEVQDRCVVLGTEHFVDLRRPVSFLKDADLMKAAGSHAAIVVWKQEALAYPAGFADRAYLYEPGSGSNVWPTLRESLEEARPKLDSAAAAVLSGPVGFQLDATAGAYMLLPHLPSLNYFTEMLGARALLALHDHDAEAAWTNLLAATRMATAWRTEPTEISQSVRLGLVQKAFLLTWQALQSGWPEDRLVRLQREWESLDLFKSLPDTVAFTGAGYVALCQQQPGSDNAAKKLLLFYHDRELEIRRAIQSHTWMEMRRLPAVTNAFFCEAPATNVPANAASQMSMRRMVMERRGGLDLLGRAAEAEARRQLILAALALERFRLRQGAYPESLAALTPELLKAPPTDFINGQPLHYSLTGDGHFFLYSVGLDGADDGGGMSPASHAHQAGIEPLPRDPDIVWPLPASAAAASAHVAEVEKRVQHEEADQKERLAKHAAEVEAARQAAANELLSDLKFRKATWVGADTATTEPEYKGQPLTRLLRNEKSAGTNQLSLDALFALKRMVTDLEPEVVTYQLPVSYDKLTNLFGAHLTLLMDSPPDESYLNEPELADCGRADNGDCLLAWNTAFERPGRHAMQAFLSLRTTVDHELEVKGPATPYWSSNLCRFSPGSSLFDDSGAYLFALVVESNATYRIEIQTRSGKLVKTLTGSTTNGLIDLEWDLMDDRGQKYTNHSFVSHFQIRLPGSGRTQTLKQPQNKLGTSGD